MIHSYILYNQNCKSNENFNSWGGISLKDKNINHRCLEKWLTPTGPEKVQNEHLIRTQLRLHQKDSEANL